MLDKVLMEGALEGLPNRMRIWIGENTSSKFGRNVGFSPTLPYLSWS